MRQLKLVAMLLMTCCLAGGALAQDAKSTSHNANSPVLRQIPAGSMGYLVVNNLKDSMGAVDKFLLDIGVGQFIKEDAPDGIMAMLQKELGLGEGFDASGGLAIVMLDPTQFNIDLAALVERKMKGERITDVKLPFVVFIPGSDIAKTLPSLPARKEGDFTIIDLPIGPMSAIEYNGYILLSPNDQALLAVKNAKIVAQTELTIDRADLIARSNIFVQLNMKTSWPIFTKMIDIAEKQAASQPSHDDMGNVLKMWQDMGVLKMYKELLGQMDSVTIAGGIGKTGIVFETLVDWNPGSDMGKTLASVQISDKPLLGRVPNMTYALAIGSSRQITQTPAMIKMQNMGTDMLTKMVSMVTQGKVNKEQVDRAMALSQELSNQCTGSQLVIGGAPENSGLVGLANVIECNDAAKAKDSIIQLVALAQEDINSAVTDEKERPVITYTKAGEGDLDVIEITHPELLNMPEDARQKMKAIIGEDKIRILIGSPDAKTLVCTFGGGKAFMTEALKAATTGGTLPQDAGLAQAMENMPKNLVCVMALNTSNLFDLILKGTQTFGVPPIPFSLTNKVPLTCGIGITGSSEHVVLYVPTPLVKEVTGIIMMQTMMRQTRPAKATSVPNDADF